MNLLYRVLVKDVMWSPDGIAIFNYSDLYRFIYILPLVKWKDLWMTAKVRLALAVTEAT